MMEETSEFFSGLFSTDNWPPRWICGEWTSFHGWLYIFSDIAIWLAYFIIPVIIIYFIEKRRNLPFLPVFWLFGAFIILCGSTHLLDALMFWWPAYRLSAVLRFTTAIVSVFTAFALIRDLPRFLMLEAHDDKASLLEQRDEEIRVLKEKVKELGGSAV